MRKLWIKSCFILCLIPMLCLSGCGTVVTEKELSTVGTESTAIQVTETEQEVVVVEDVITPEVKPTELGKIGVKFIDVGQADSCLIVTPKNEIILIDAGESRDAEEIMYELDKLEFDDIDLMVLTHPHADHIGGASTIIENYEVEEVLMSSFPATSKLFENLLTDLEENNIKTTQAVIGMEYNIDGLVMKVLAVDTVPKDNNNSSIVMKLSYGDIDMMFTGDAEEPVEEEILKRNADIECEILKVGHHGSETSTTDMFLDVVKPSLCVISVGEGNKYNHPAVSLLDRLKEKSITYYRTDEVGTVELDIDGKNIVSNFSDSHTTENSRSTRFILEPAVAEVHLEVEEKVLDDVAGTSK